MSTPSNYNYNAVSWGQPIGLPAAPQRPAAVERGFWLLIASAVVSLISGILSVVAMMADMRRSELLQTSGVSSAEADTVITLGIVAGVGLGVISVAVSVLFAVFARKGHNWARIVITVFAGLSLLGLIEVNGSLDGILDLVSILLIIAAAVMLFTAPASAYFNQMTQYRQAKSLGYTG